MVSKFAERANADALRRAAERSQSMIDAQRAAEEGAQERAILERREKIMKEKMAKRRARDEAAIMKAREKAAAERMARQSALPVNVAISEKPKDMQEWHERRARARKRDIRSSSSDT